jgi:hypothetical protein
MTSSSRVTTREASITRSTLPAPRSRSLIKAAAREPVKLKKYFTIGSSAELEITCGTLES